MLTEEEKISALDSAIWETNVVGMPSPQNPSIFFPNAAFDVVALATSAGCLIALSQILQALPVDLPAAIAIVQHLDPHATSLLPSILSRRTKLKVKQAESG